VSNVQFDTELPIISDFEMLTRAGSFAPLPDDWHIALCDVRDSTVAIDNGKYRNVNSIGAAAITAVINAAGEIEVPFSFEGDGCVLCVPPQLLEDTRAALAKTQQVAREVFDLDLRIATVPVAAIPAGLAVRVARYRVSDNYVQAMFSGGGISFADAAIKDPATEAIYAIAPGSVEPRGSHEGFECRWEDIPSRHGETVSLMVMALHDDESDVAEVYRDVIRKVHEIYGDAENCHPVSVPQLDMTLDARLLDDEVGVRSAGSGWLSRWWRLMHTRMMVLLGRVLMHFGTQTQETDWGRYKATLASNSDVRKFSDVYRQILAGNLEQRLALDAWLQDQYQQQRLLYGLHVTDRAHMTCLVFDYAGRHLHFIDGADGGLFLAAKAFKERATQYINRSGA